MAWREGALPRAPHDHFPFTEEDAGDWQGVFWLFFLKDALSAKCVVTKFLMILLGPDMG